MKQLTLEIAFKSSEYFPDCTHVIVDLSDKQIEKLRRLNEVAKDPDIFSVNVDCYCPVKFMIEDYDDEPEFKEDDEFRPNPMYFILYGGETAYLYAQSKYDSSIQVESEAFNIETLTPDHEIS